MSDHSELKRLAEAAPEGPWFGPEYAPGTSYVFDADLGALLHYESIDTEQDACLRYVAAANPAAVLALIAENKRLSELLECAQGDLKQAMKVIEKNGKDAERYRYLRTDVTRGGPYDFCIVRKNWGNPALERILTLEDADQEIDAAKSKEG